jgi:hypothetical protein
LHATVDPAQASAGNASAAMNASNILFISTSVAAERGLTRSRREPSPA